MEDVFMEKLINNIVARGRLISNVIEPTTSRRVINVLIKDGDRVNFVHFTIEDPELAENVKRLKKNDHVTIKGFTRASRYYNRTFDKFSNISYFVASEVARDTPMLETSFKADYPMVQGRFYERPFFRAEIAGRISSIIDNGNPVWSKLVVETKGGGIDARASRITVGYFHDPKRSRLPEFDYLVGDEVLLIASVSTPRKTINGVTQDFENLNVEDIMTVKRVERPEVPEAPKAEQKAEKPKPVNTVDTQEEEMQRAMGIPYEAEDLEETAARPESRVEEYEDAEIGEPAKKRGFGFGALFS